MNFPHYLQLDSMDCGATCLRMVSKFYGKAYPAVFFRERCHTTREGVSMLGISDAAESVGFRTSGVKITFEQLCDDVPFPCIVHWNQNHFAVVYDIKKRRSGEIKIYVADPAAGLLCYDQKRFLKSWLSIAEDDEHSALNQGTALLLEPTPNFYQEDDASQDEKKLNFAHLIGYLRPYRRYIVQLVLGLLSIL